MAKIVVFGGAHIDRRGILAAPWHQGSSHPGKWHIEAGGGAFNAARNLARFGHQVTVVAPRGGDPFGEMIENAALSAGVEYRPFTFLDRQTPSYTAILEEDGNVITGLADMDLYNLFTHRRLRVRAVRRLIEESDAILCDANLPAETLSAIAFTGKVQSKFTAALGISPSKVTRLREALPNLSLLCMNFAEAKALTGKQTIDECRAALQSENLRAATITSGPQMLTAYHNGQIIRLRPPGTAEIKDATGAGDAFAAAVISSMLSGEPIELAVRKGVGASLITLFSPHAFAPEISSQSVDAIAQTIACEAPVLHH